MNSKRNKLMNMVSFGMILLVISINVLGRVFHLFDYSHGHMQMLSMNQIESSFGFALNILFIVPIFLFVLNIVITSKFKNHPLIPILNTLVLTFSSISIIAGSGGRVEFHFSIFMVVAILGYYQRINLMLLMTAIFAVQHLAGIFFFPEIVFGVNEYNFLMLVIHALFLVFTSTAVSLQIVSNHAVEKELQRQNLEIKKQITEDIIAQLSASSSNISEKANLLIKCAKETKVGQTVIDQSVEDVVIKALNQLNSANVGEQSIQEISEQLQQISTAANEVTDQSSDATEFASNGKQVIDRLVKQVSILKTSIKDTTNTVNKLDKDSKNISTIVSAIQSIADQTNLLSLNASIEAARAGEYGKGFAVVANEVRKLAEESGQYVNEINKIVSEISSGTLQTVKSISKVEEEITASLDSTRETELMFLNITSLSTNISNQMEEIYSSVEQISAGSEQAVNSVTTIHDLTNQVQASASDILNVSEKQSFNIIEIEEIATSLYQLTNELNSVMEKVRGSL